MTTTQTILWTALPTGRKEELLRLSVYLSPRLVTNVNLPTPRLGQFPDFVDWAGKSAKLGFTAVFDAGQQPVRLRADRVSPPPDPALWHALFVEKALVRPYQFDVLSDRIIRSFPGEGIHSYLRQAYGRIGEQSPTQPPPLSDDRATTLSGLITELGPVRDNPAENGAATMEADLARDGVLLPGSLHGFTTEPRLAFHQAARFYSRPENASPPGPIDPKKTPPPPEAPVVDFHQMVARLADHPALLRLFGLVVDLEVVLPDSTTVPSGDAKHEATVRIEPDWPPDDPPVWLGNPSDPTHSDRSLRTRYLLTPNEFRALPREPSDLADGMLKLDDPERFTLFSADIDGAALKVADFAQAMLAILTSANSPYTKPDQAALPALRSGGFTVTRKDRAVKVQEHLQTSEANNAALDSGIDPVLFAEDLTRGYRVDVFDDQSNQWHSLCGRTGTYEFPGTGAPPVGIKDEGYVTGASATSAGQDTKPDLYLHEAMFGWDGWGLCAARPGRTIVPRSGTDGQQQESVERVTNTPVADFPLQVNVRVPPGSLPRLRYGTSYRIRARAVDLAGNSEPPDSKDATHATAPQPYLRFEPVAPPVLLLREPITEGESLEHMVIRSNHDVAAADYVELPQVKQAIAGKEYRYLPANERHVAPPKIAQLTAETHGMFDAFLGPGGNPERGFVLAVREEGTFLDTVVVDPTTGEPTVPVPGIELITPPGVTPAPGETLPTLPLTRGQPLAPGQYVIHRAEHVLLPYLPDVLAHGVLFAGVRNPGTTSLINLQFPFDGEWPDLDPFRLRIEEGEGSPVINKDRHLLTVPLSKGTMTTLRYSCYLAPGDPQKMGIFHWITEPDLGMILGGQHWMFTPPRELVLVHAVQQPLTVPELTLTVVRASGATAAGFNGTIGCHSQSTSRIDVHAEWQEATDLVTKDGPETAAKKARVAGYDVGYGDNGVVVIPIEKASGPNGSGPRRMVHEFGDTKHRSVEYYGVATTRYREYFPPAITADPANVTRSGRAATPEDNSGQRVRVTIPSSARPAAPKPQYVIPTFLWQQQDLPGGGLKRTRVGNGLRIYLDRPWFSSGDGELLAVVLAETATIPDQLKPYVTQWGSDPLWFPATAKTPPELSHFPLRKKVGTGLSLDELSGPTVTAVGHAVAYDPSRKLWFCDIDVDVSTPSYYPFIRLAIARFQPNSLAGAHLSRVVLSDFVQLTATRTATLTFSAPTQLSVTVTGLSGLNNVTQLLDQNDKVTPATNPTANLDASRTVLVTLQQPVNPGKLDDELGWTAVGKQTLLTPKATPNNGQLDWTGTITLPSVPKRKGGLSNFRVLIQELERFRSDTDVSEFIHRHGGQQIPMRSRLVYADAPVI